MEKRIVKNKDGSINEINIIISFKYEKNDKNYIVYTFGDKSNTFISSFDILDDNLILNEIDREEADEVNMIIKEKILGGNE